jgi:hypothetical protein
MHLTPAQLTEAMLKAGFTAAMLRDWMRDYLPSRKYDAIQKSPPRTA